MASYIINLSETLISRAISLSLNPTYLVKDEKIIVNLLVDELSNSKKDKESFSGFMGDMIKIYGSKHKIRIKDYDNPLMKEFEGVLDEKINSNLRIDFYLTKSSKIAGVKKSFIVCPIAIKYNSENITKEDKVKLCSHLLFISEGVQKWMSYAYGILLTQTKILFMRLDLESRPRLSISYVNLFDRSLSGPLRLINLISDYKLMDSIELGTLSNSHKPLGEFVGDGSTSIVFRSSEEPDNILKLFRGVSEDHMVKEFKTLESLQEIISEENKNFIPKVISHSESYNCIEIYPYSSEFCYDRNSYDKERRFTVQHALQLLGVLKDIHSHGIVHRDISPANLMLSRHGVLVNDWGAAIKDNILEDFHGSIRYASYSVLTQLKYSESVRFRVSDDLISYVKTMCVIFEPSLKISSGIMDFDKIIEHWEKLPDEWKHLIKEAESSNHDKVKELLITLIGSE